MVENFKSFLEKINIPLFIINNLLDLLSDDFLIFIKDYELENSFDYERSYKKLVNILEFDENNHKILLFSLYKSFLIKERYDNLKIDENIYYDTYKCFSRFLLETGIKNDKYNFDRAWWTIRQITFKLFRIGQLEYEITKDNLISIHIPSDAILDREIIINSFREANIFFKTYFGNLEIKYFYLDSWLLSNNVRLSLPINSNIRIFQDFFNIIKHDEKDNEGKIWLYKRTDDDYKSYPNKTTLQKNILKLLMKGKSIGSGLGILKEEYLNYK